MATIKTLFFVAFVGMWCQSETWHETNASTFPRVCHMTKCNKSYEHCFSTNCLLKRRLVRQLKTHKIFLSRECPWVFVAILLLPSQLYGDRGSTVVKMLVRFQIVSLEFFIDVKSFRSHYGPGVDSASNRNEYQEHFLGVKTAGA